MNPVFVPTENFLKADKIASDLLGTVYGSDIYAFIGRSGSGKTTIAQRMFVTNNRSVYVLFCEGWNHVELLREITFRLSGARPRFQQVCFEMIQNEMEKKRRLLMIDESDRLNLKCLNVLRNIHDVCKVPVLLIGEEDLESKIARERRLISRLRGTLYFDPVLQADITVFFKYALGIQLTPDMSGKLLKHSGGDFRNVVTYAVKIERIMKASGLESITDLLIDKVCNNGNLL